MKAVFGCDTFTIVSMDSTYFRTCWDCWAQIVPHVTDTYVTDLFAVHDE
jgi:hypothetical protein